MSTGEAATTQELLARAKALQLSGRDALMNTTANSYDVTDATEWSRSVDDLSRLFFAVAKALEVDLFIEANPFTYRRQSAQHDFAGAGVEYLHTALGADTGEVTFQVLRGENGEPRADGQSSLLVRDQPGAAENVVEVTVPATTLDAFFADHRYERSALWVDVEGAMQQVLAGAATTLDRVAVVMAEVEDRAYWNGQWLRPDVLSDLYDRGLIPIARDYQSRYQYNIVFVAREHLERDRVRWLTARYMSAAARAQGQIGPVLPRAQLTAKRAAVRSTSSAELITVLRRRSVDSARRRLVLDRSRRAGDPHT